MKYLLIICFSCLLSCSSAQEITYKPIFINQFTNEIEKDVSFCLTKDSLLYNSFNNRIYLSNVGTYALNFDCYNTGYSFDILISKRQQELKDVDNDLLDEPVVIDGLIFKYQENIDDYKKTNTYKIKHEKHLICNLCNNPFFGYTEAMYRQAPLSTKKQTKYWKHFERNGGKCIDECDKCTNTSDFILKYLISLLTTLYKIIFTIPDENMMRSLY